jgi:hypothetical protein
LGSFRDEWVRRLTTLFRLLAVPPPYARATAVFVDENWIRFAKM